MIWCLCNVFMDWIFDLGCVRINCDLLIYDSLIMCVCVLFECVYIVGMLLFW